MTLSAIQKINLQKLSGVSSMLGIDLTEKRARVVELVQQGGIFNKFKSIFTAKSHFTVTFNENSSVEERANQLSGELKSRNVSTNRGATSIQSLGVRTVTAEIPPSVSNINDWIYDNYEKLIRIPVSIRDIVYGYEILSVGSSSYIVEVTFVRKTDIDSMQLVCAIAGLSLQSLTAGTRDALNAILFSDEFLYRDISTVVYYSDSYSSVSEFEKQKRIKTTSVEGKAIESDLDPTKTVFAGEGIEHQDTIKPFSLPPEYTLAAGCALKGFIPELNPADFLPVERVQAKNETIYKNLFQRTVFACGGIILALLILQTSISLYLSNIDEQLDRQLLESGLNYSELTILQKQNKELRSELERTGSAEFRSNNAKIFHEIAAFVPDGLWLYKIETDAIKGSITIAGYTSTGDAIAEFLKRCEKTSLFQNVRLTRSGMPLQNEDMSFVLKKISVPVTFQLQASLAQK